MGSPVPVAFKIVHTMLSRAAVYAGALALTADAYKTSRDSGYGAPEPSYGAPEPSYGAPEPSYGYEEPAQEYTGYDATSPGSPDLTPILIGILVITGLALLFPSYVTLTTTRRKRSVEGVQDESTTSNMINRVQDMYMAIMESEECIERVVCELGGLVEDAGYSKQMTRSLELFAPKKYQKMMKSFNKGKDCTKNNKCGIF